MKQKNFIELKPIFEGSNDIEKIEKQLIEIFKKEIYLPLLKVLDITINKKIKNENDSTKYIERALIDNQIYYEDGKFFGKFNANISKELKSIGATWNNKVAAFELPSNDLSANIKSSISLGKVKYQETLNAANEYLKNLDVDKIIEKVDVVPIFERLMTKIDKNLNGQIKKEIKKQDIDKEIRKEQIKSITLSPELKPNQKKEISEKWQKNYELDIKKFTTGQIDLLRASVRENVFSGYRKENLIKRIQQNYGVSENKAKFLARQETNLLMAQFKQSRYESAGSTGYRWGCVKMPHEPTPNSPYIPKHVRYAHGILEGKYFKWSDPPITTKPGEKQRRNHPMQDYNCQCYAIPVFGRIEKIG
jgi:SPP1 gp7 family putative phage head morphogenesis protein